MFIDKEGGIDIEECAFVSEQLSDKLDACDPDPIPQAYFLEVSSPGAERPSKRRGLSPCSWRIYPSFLVSAGGRRKAI